MRMYYAVIETGEYMIYRASYCGINITYCLIGLKVNHAQVQTKVWLLSDKIMFWLDTICSTFHVQDFTYGPDSVSPLHKRMAHKSHGTWQVI